MMFRRAKISHDPNNTYWSRATNNYGHQMLLSQGWTPGTYLGPSNAPHKHLHSDASASFIRTTIKDDNLGLGAKRGQGPGECTGLDAFQGLLGRLNGKDNAVLEKEQNSRDNLKRALYTERRWGTLRFISGGLLVGEKIQKLPESRNLRLPRAAQAQETPSKRDHQDTSLVSLKRKASAEDATKRTEPMSTGPRCSFVTQVSTLEGDEHNMIVVQKEQGKHDDEMLNRCARDSEKFLKKAERMQRRLDKRKRKEAKKIRKLKRRTDAIPQARITSPTPTLQENSKVDEEIIALDHVSTKSIEPTAIASITGRYAVRQRYIRQKKLAIMDPKALNEVSRYQSFLMLFDGLSYCVLVLN